MKIPLLTTAEAQQKMLERKHAHQPHYYAMYSSWFGGIVTDPALMTVPMDDHLVHRGDGVFEAMKYEEGRIYLLKEHLDRLYSSASQIFLAPPVSQPEMESLVRQTVAASGQKNGMIRLFVSRGPGTFSPNPYDSVGAQIYIVITSFKPLSPDKYTHGVHIGRSQIPPKDGWLARVKTCNYLPNVLMKKEAVDRGLDFTVGFAEDGFLTESSTENIILVDNNRRLVHPKLAQILSGTTMRRAFSLAQSLVGDLITGIDERDVSEDDLINSKELMMAGTTLEILPVVTYEKQYIGDGKVGPVAKRLLELVRADQR